MKRLINIIRYNYFASLILRVLLTPIEKLCSFLSTQIKMKIWINGATVCYDGIKLKFPKNNGVGYCGNIWWEGVNGFEKDTWLVIKTLLMKCDLFIDVGSNIGVYSVLAKKIRPGLQVHSYEPVPCIFDRNMLFHRANFVDVNDIHNLAVSDQVGLTEIYLPITDTMEEETTATLRKDSWQFAKAHETHVIQTTTLDQLLEQQELSKILVKVDVEDSEVRVLRGSRNSLCAKKPIFVCEILPREHHNLETTRFLNESNYEAFAITSNGLFRFREQDFSIGRRFTDFLLVHKSFFSPDKNFVDLETLKETPWI